MCIRDSVKAQPVPVSCVHLLEPGYDDGRGEAHELRRLPAADKAGAKALSLIHICPASRQSASSSTRILLFIFGLLLICLLYTSYLSHGPGAFAYVIDLLLNFMLQLLYAGFVIFVLNMIRRQANSFWNLMDGFQHFLKIIGLNIVSGIFVFLWSLLFVIPGIVASYRYRQALYLLLDHPEMGIMECIRESKRLMRCV